jgi:competence protein ComEC
MFNLMGLGKLYFRNTAKNQINILLVSAFILLSYNPWLITDIGFLLSYFAMLGLLHYQPLLAELYTPRNYIENYLWVSVTASFAATISTLPITLFIFKQFPLWFFVCNIVVVPATFLLLFLALVAVFHVPFIAGITNILITFLIHFINLFDKKNAGYIDQICFGWHDAIILSLLIVLASAALQKRNFVLLRAALVVLVFWQFTSLIESGWRKNESVFAVYQLKGASAISMKDNKLTHIFYTDSSALDFNVKPHLISYNYPEVKTSQFNFVKQAHEQILIVGKKGSFPNAVLDSVTTLVLCKNASLRAADLERMPVLRKVVVDGSNNKRARGRVADLCRKFAVNFYDTSVEGAFLLAFH